MKKFSLLLIIMTFLQIFPVNVLAQEVIVPKPSKDINLISYDDFETDTLSRWEWWDSNGNLPTISIDGDNGTNVLNMVEYDYYLPNSSFQNYTLEYNFKCSDYDSYPEIRFQKNGSKFFKLYIAASDTICVEGSDSWIGSAPFDFSKYNNKWVYIKLEIYGDTLKYYVNDSVTPVMTLSDPNLNKSGGIGFAGVNKLDNVMLSRPKRVVPIPMVNEETQKLLASSNGSLEGWGSDLTPLLVEDDGEMVYSVQNYDTFMIDSFSQKRNYTIEFNMKIDYTILSEGEPIFGRSWPGMYLRTQGKKKYNMYFESSVGSEALCVEAVDDSMRKGVGGSSDTSFLEEQDCWAYMKIEMIGNITNIYYMNKTTPAIVINPDNSDKDINYSQYGGFGFVRGGANKFLIKNLIITEPKFANVMDIIPETEKNQTVLLDQNYENSIKGFVGAEDKIVAEDNNKVFKIEDANYTTRTDFENFTMEFNMKNDYAPFGKSFPAIHFRVANNKHYELRLDSILGKNQLVLRRGNSNLKTYPVWIIDNNDKWDYFKIEVYGNNIKVYYNDKVTPVINYTDSSPILNKGAIGFIGGTNTKIDNLLIYSSCKPVVINTSEVAENKLKLNVTSYFAEDKKAKLILAVFSDNRFLQTTTKEVLLNKNKTDGEELLTTDLSVDIPCNGDIKAYLIDDNSNIYMDSYPNTTFGSKVTVIQPTAEVVCENSRLKVFGKSGNNSSLLIRIAKDGKILDIAQSIANDKGEYKHEFTMFEDYSEGKYDISISSEIGTEKIEKSLIYVLESKLTTYIENLNKYSSTQIFEYLKEAKLYSEKLGMNMKKYDAISDDNLKLSVCSEIVNSKPFTKENISNIFNMNLVLPYIKDSKDEQDFKTRFEAQIKEFELTDDLYKNLNDEMKIEVCKGLYHNCKKYFTVADLKADVPVNLLLCTIYKSNYNAMEDILAKNEKVLGIDVSKISSITNATKKTEFFKGLNSKRCYSYEEFRELYNELIAIAVKSDDDESGSSGGGNSGGGSSNSSGNKNLPFPIITPTQEKMSFTDVESSHWGYEAISYLSKNKIINGFSDNTFKPDKEITRGEFTKLLITAFDLLDEDAKCEFKDVKKDDWSYKYIASAKEKGIILGNSDNIFNPNDVITREDMATVLHRTIKAKKIRLEITKNTLFTDDDEISDYARESVSYLANTDVIQGVSKGVFAPQESTTRAAASKMIYTILKGAK